VVHTVRNPGSVYLTALPHVEEVVSLKRKVEWGATQQ
jgi:hypothetical protein